MALVMWEKSRKFDLRSNFFAKAQAAKPESSTLEKISIFILYFARLFVTLQRFLSKRMGNMIYFLEATPIEAGKGVIEAAKNGQVDQLIQQVTSMGLEAGKSLLLAVVLAVVGRYAIRFINRLVARMLERRNVEPTVQSFLKSFVNILLITLLIITVVGTLGVNTTSLAALLASAGLAVGMALSGNLQNLAGGIILLFLKPFKIGDFIEVQGVSGTVKAIQIFHTILTTTDNKVLFVPNGALSGGNITNYTKNPLRRVDLVIGVEYGSDVEEVKQVTQDILGSDSRILAEPAPFFRVSALADSSVDFTLRVWVKAEDYWDVFFDLQETIYAEYNKHGIGFPFPQLQIHQ